ncbi:MAG: sigma-70 family RNA polymerase sigma factor [Planctomycetes bacterium]|nr:sigma-70 family RNA polymerase sigma factor [Planctomycetota bacterium]
MDLPSEHLLAAAAGGDRDALATLLQRHLPGVRAYLRLRMGPMIRANEDSEDLVQSVCREILVRAEDFAHGGEQGFRRWLFRTAQRKVADRADYYRAQKRAHRTSPLDVDDDAVAACYGSVCTPSRAASAREHLSRVEAAFDRLPEAQREVILAVRMLGLSHAELAQRLGKTEGAVRVMLFRAMAQLTELLGDGA